MMSDQSSGAGSPSPQERNDDRSQQMDPEHDRGQAAADNRGNQLNPEHPAYGSSREGGAGGGNG
jgi:hypothetical protein